MPAKNQKKSSNLRINTKDIALPAVEEEEGVKFTEDAVEDELHKAKGHSRRKQTGWHPHNRSLVPLPDDEDEKDKEHGEKTDRKHSVNSKMSGNVSSKEEQCPDYCADDGNFNCEGNNQQGNNVCTPTSMTCPTAITYTGGRMYGSHNMDTCGTSEVFEYCQNLMEKRYGPANNNNAGGTSIMVGMVGFGPYIGDNMRGNDQFGGGRNNNLTDRNGKGGEVNYMKDGNLNGGISLGTGGTGNSNGVGANGIENRSGVGENCNWDGGNNNGNGSGPGVSGNGNRGNNPGNGNMNGGNGNWHVGNNPGTENMGGGNRNWNGGNNTGNGNMFGVNAGCKCGGRCGKENCSCGRDRFAKGYWDGENMVVPLKPRSASEIGPWNSRWQSEYTMEFGRKIGASHRYPERYPDTVLDHKAYAYHDKHWNRFGNWGGGNGNWGAGYGNGSWFGWGNRNDNRAGDNGNGNWGGNGFGNWGGWNGNGGGDGRYRGQQQGNSGSNWNGGPSPGQQGSNRSNWNGGPSFGPGNPGTRNAGPYGSPPEFGKGDIIAVRILKKGDKPRMTSSSPYQNTSNSTSGLQPNPRGTRSESMANRPPYDHGTENSPPETGPESSQNGPGKTSFFHPPGLVNLKARYLGATEDPINPEHLWELYADNPHSGNKQPANSSGPSGTPSYDKSAGNRLNDDDDSYDEYEPSSASVNQIGEKEQPSKDLQKKGGDAKLRNKSKVKQKPSQTEEKQKPKTPQKKPTDKQEKKSAPKKKPAPARVKSKSNSKTKPTEDSSSSSDSSGSVLIVKKITTKRTTIAD